MTRKNWFEANPRKAKGLVFLVCLVFVEIAIRLLVWVDLLPYRTYQTDTTPQFWANVDPVVGRWRWPDKTWRHREGCLDTIYVSNSIGARDPERAFSARGAERVVMLGDSYLEGFGVDYGERTSDLLEQMTGIEHLNLGITDFGTIQEWLAYERFGLRYEHARVIVFIFPENDFDNNDPNDESKNVYRPFLRKTGTGFEVYYTVDFDDRYTGSISAATVIKNRFDNAIYTANVGRWATRALKTVYEEKKPVEAATHYNGYSREDMEIMQFALGRLVDLAGDRPVYLVMAPTIVDLEYAARNGADSQLIEDIGIFSASRSNVRLIDLVPYFLEDAQTTGRDFWDYTLGCDRHWSLAGHRLVAESLFKEIYPEAP